MPLNLLEIQINEFSSSKLKERTDYIRAHIDNGGKCSQRNAYELLLMVERAIVIIEDDEEVKGF